MSADLSDVDLEQRPSEGRIDVSGTVGWLWICLRR